MPRPFLSKLWASPHEARPPVLLLAALPLLASLRGATEQLGRGLELYAEMKEAKIKPKRRTFTPLFRPTFEGEGVIRSGDITADPRYGQQPPLHGMPPGHLPVRSYLAVPVHGASRERFEPDDSFQTDGVVGALLFGHPEPDTFDAAAERAARTLAGQASLALRNARLHRALAAELAERKRAETALRESEAQFREIAESLPQLVWTTTPEGYHDYFNECWYRYTGMPRPDEPGGEHRVARGHFFGAAQAAQQPVAGELRITDECVSVA